MKYEVERKDLSALPRKQVRACARYPFDQMKIGESFFVPAIHRTPSGLQTVRSNLSGSANAYSKRHGLRFSILMNRDLYGYHCQRIA